MTDIASSYKFAVGLHLPCTCSSPEGISNIPIKLNQDILYTLAKTETYVPSMEPQ